MSVLLLLGVLLIIVGAIVWLATKNLFAALAAVAGIILVVVALFSDDTVSDDAGSIPSSGFVEAA